MKNSLSEAATSGTNLESGKGREEEKEEGISAKRRKLSHDYDGKSSQLLPTRV